MIPRPARLLVVLLLAAAGRLPSAAVAADPAGFITNVTVERQLRVFAGVLPAFTESDSDLNISHQFLVITDNNGNAHTDETTTVISLPNSLSVTGDAVADLTVQSALLPPAASNCSVRVHFTTTVPTDFTLTGSVSSTNLALPSDDVASCTLTGPGVSLAFGKMGPAGPWNLTGDFSGILPPGTYELALVLATGTVNPTVQQKTTFSNLAFHVATFATLRPGKYNGLLRAAPGTIPGNDTEGTAAVTVKKKSRFSAKITVGGSVLSAAGTIDTGGRFLGKDGSPALVLKRKGKPNVALALVGNGTPDDITGTLIDTATNATSALDLDLAVYTSKPNPPAPFRNPPAGLVGSYTVIFPPTAPGGQALTPSITADRYPQGTGWATLTVDKKGNAKLKGRLADGTPIGCAGALSKENAWPLYVALYGNTGSISGRIVFENLAGSDLDGPGLRWFNRGGAAVYPSGWPAGIVTDVVGSRYVPPAAGVGAITGIPTTPGAAAVHLSDAGIVNSPVTVAATIDAGSKVSIVGDNASLALKVTLNAKTGAAAGSFLHPATSRTAPFSGVIVQKLGKAFGFFLNAPQSGGFTID